MRVTDPSTGRRRAAVNGRGYSARMQARNCPGQLRFHTLRGRDVSGQYAPPRKPEDWDLPATFVSVPEPQCHRSSASWPRFFKPSVWTTRIRSSLETMPSPVESSRSSAQCASGRSRSEVAESRTRPHIALHIVPPTEPFPAPKAGAPRTGILHLHVSGLQAATRFISSFQRWQATSCPSSVSSAGS